MVEWFMIKDTCITVECRMNEWMNETISEVGVSRDVEMRKHKKNLVRKSTWHVH